MGVGEAEARAFIEASTPEGEASPYEAEQGPLAVWPENWPAVGLLMRLQTQWMRDEQRRPLGMRHEAMQAAMTMLKLDDTATLYDQLVEMEQAALEVVYGH